LASHEKFFLLQKLQSLKFNTNTANGNYLCSLDLRCFACFSERWKCRCWRCEIISTDSNVGRRDFCKQN